MKTNTERCGRAPGASAETTPLADATRKDTLMRHLGGLAGMHSNVHFEACFFVSGSLVMLLLLSYLTFAAHHLDLT